MKDYEILEGKVPILLSAPHVFNHYRSSLKMSYKQAEPYTDQIVKEIARRVNCFAIFPIKELDYDPNSSLLENNPYKREVGRLIKGKKIKLFIDFHGLSDQYSYDLGIYYGLRYRNAKQEAYKIANGLNSKELRDILIQMRNFSVQNNKETLSEFVVKNFKKVALQIEIVRYIREDELLRNSFVSILSNILLNK